MFEPVLEAFSKISAGMAIYHGCYAKPDVYSNYSLLVKTLEKFTKF